MKQLNIQHAIDSLRAEEEKRMVARAVFLRDKKTALQKTLNIISEQKRDFSRE
jgi:hypothetical protein